MKIMGENPIEKVSRTSTLRSQNKLSKFKHTNPYINFLCEFRMLPENNNLMGKEIFQLAGYNWKRLSEQEKFPYIKAANEAKQLLLKTKYAKKNESKKRRRSDDWNFESTISRSSTYVSNTIADTDDLFSAEPLDTTRTMSSDSRTSLSTDTASTGDTKTVRTRTTLYESDVSSETTF